MDHLVKPTPSAGQPSEGSKYLVACMYGVAVLASGVPLLAAHWIGPYRHDDVYITLTFARNIAAGAGFVYNGGSPILGTTSPLLALLVAGISELLSGVSLLTIATGISVAAWIATAWLLAAWWKKLGGNPIGVAAIAILLLTQLGGAAILGMEASLFQFLLVATLYLYLSDRLAWAGLGLGLLFLTRGEGALLGPILLLWDFLFKKRISWRLIGTTALVLLVWSVYGYVTFGSFLPSTLDAKIAQRESGLWRPFGERLFTEWLPGRFTFTPVSVVFAALTAGGLLSAIRMRREWLIFPVWGVTYVISYMILNPAGYWWYAMPVFFVFDVLAALGLAALTTLAGQIKERGRWLATGLPIVACVFIVVIAAANVWLLRNSLVSYAATVDPTSNSVSPNGYFAASEWFRDNTASYETIAYVEAGYLGFYTRNRFVDLTGLLTPGVADHLRVRDLTWGFLHYKPDYVLVAPEFDWIMGETRHLPEFNEMYRLVYEMERPQREPLQIYARLDSTFLVMGGGREQGHSK